MSKNRVVPAKSKEYEILGRNLLAARQSLNISQAEAAKLIGVAQSTYCGYETGIRNIQISMLRRIAYAFGVPVDLLMRGNTSDIKPKPAITLSELEKDMILKFRSMSKVEQGVILKILELDS